MVDDVNQTQTAGGVQAVADNDVSNMGEIAASKSTSVPESDGNMETAAEVCASTKATDAPQEIVNVDSLPCNETNIDATVSNGNDVPAAERCTAVVAEGEVNEFVSGTVEVCQEGPDNAEVVLRGEEMINNAIMGMGAEYEIDSDPCMDMTDSDSDSDINADDISGVIDKVHSPMKVHFHGAHHSRFRKRSIGLQRIL